MLRNRSGTDDRAVDALQEIRAATSINIPNRPPDLRRGGPLHEEQATRLSPSASTRPSSLPRDAASSAYSALTVTFERAASAVTPSTPAGAGEPRPRPEITPSRERGVSIADRQDAVGSPLPQPSSEELPTCQEVCIWGDEQSDKMRVFGYLSSSGPVSKDS